MQRFHVWIAISVLLLLVSPVCGDPSFRSLRRQMDSSNVGALVEPAPVHSLVEAEAEAGGCQRLGGSCMDVTQCHGMLHSGLCPGAANIKCCVPNGATVPSTSTSTVTSAAPVASSGVVSAPGSKCEKASGRCINTNVGSCSSAFQSGMCPGAANIKCCLSASTPASTPAPAPAPAPAAPVSNFVDKCTYGGQLGNCLPTSATCAGVRVTGLCSGRSDVTCCMPSKDGKTVSSVQVRRQPGRTRITQTTLQRLSEKEHRAKWARFKALHRPNYSTSAEEAAAYKIFRANRVRVIYLNDRYGGGYILWSSRSPFTATDPTEFNRRHGAPAIDPRVNVNIGSGSTGFALLETESYLDPHAETEAPADEHWEVFQQFADKAQQQDEEASDDNIMAFIEQQQDPTNTDATSVAAAPAPEPESPIKWIVNYQDKMLPVRQQWSCGSCWAHTAGGVIEGAMIKAGMSPVSISVEWFLDCDKSGKQLRCTGGYHEIALASAAAATPAKESEMPYAPFSEQPTCRVPNGSSHVRVSNGGYAARCTDNACNSPDEDAVLQALQKYGPLGVVVDANNWPTFDNGGIFPSEACLHGRLQTGHAVVLVGYGVETATGRAFWLIRNSYSEGWGNKGHIRIEARAGGSCGLANRPFWVTVKKV